METIRNIFRNGPVGMVSETIRFMLGRGLMTTGSLVATLFMLGNPGAPILVPLLFVGLSTGLTLFSNFTNQRKSEYRVMDQYREEIAAVLGKSPEGVTVDDLHLVADGNREKGIPPNPVIDQELDRIANYRTMQFVTTGVSAILTAVLGVGVLGMGGFGEYITSTIQGINSLTGTIGAAIGFSLPIGLANRAFNGIMDGIGERILGFNEPTVHNRLTELVREVERGNGLTQEQVFGIFVAAHPQLDKFIKQEYGLDYHDMPGPLQQKMVGHYGAEFNVAGVTQAINQGRMKPSELAFTVVNQHSGVPENSPNETELQPAKEKSKAKSSEEKPEISIRDGQGFTNATTHLGGTYQGQHAPKVASQHESGSMVERYAQQRHDPARSYRDKLALEAAARVENARH